MAGLRGYPGDQVRFQSVTHVLKPGNQSPFQPAASRFAEPPVSNVREGFSRHSPDVGNWRHSRLESCFDGCVRHGPHLGPSCRNRGLPAESGLRLMMTRISWKNVTTRRRPPPANRAAINPARSVNRAATAAAVPHPPGRRSRWRSRKSASSCTGAPFPAIARRRRPRHPRPGRKPATRAAASARQRISPSRERPRPPRRRSSASHAESSNRAARRRSRLRAIVPISNRAGLPNRRAAEDPADSQPATSDQPGAGIPNLPNPQALLRQWAALQQRLVVSVARSLPARQRRRNRSTSGAAPPPRGPAFRAHGASFGSFPSAGSARSGRT